jgi:hypothetical protein
MMIPLMLNREASGKFSVGTTFLAGIALHIMQENISLLSGFSLKLMLSDVLSNFSLRCTDVNTHEKDLK